MSEKSRIGKPKANPGARVSRRDFAKCTAAITALSGMSGRAFAQEGAGFEYRWDNLKDRVFLGGDFWANPMEDWSVADGAAVCRGGGNRNVHLLTRELAEPRRGFVISAVFDAPSGRAVTAGAGFRIGLASEISEYRSNCFIHEGLDAIVKPTQLILGERSAAIDWTPGQPLRVILAAKPARPGGRVPLTLTAETISGDVLGEVQVTVPAARLLGNMSLVANADAHFQNKDEPEIRFSEWRGEGAALQNRQNRSFGPIMWTQYTVSDSRSRAGHVLRLATLTAPLGTDTPQEIDLQFETGEGWQSQGHAELNPDGWVAIHEVQNIDPAQSIPFRVLYDEHRRNGSTKRHEYRGVVRAAPADRPLRLGALTCQNAIGFPYEPVARNLAKVDPDLLFFSGDQLYESHGGYGIIRDDAERAILNYLRKFYMHGWAFRDVMAERPTVCIPDDHDVFQGNYWGEGGAAMDKDPVRETADDKGGYAQPVRMVNAVHRTCVGHHPEFGQRADVKRGMSTYFGDMVWGNVSFAILADRQFKSGPEHVDTGRGRADHIHDRDFDTASLDRAGLSLLGERQEAFLAEWARDRRGHVMKVVLSQTVFGGMATHHGTHDGYLKGDLDSNGWPQTPRDRAVALLRDAKALHVNGDQHLTTMTQYGIDKQRDAGWSFCVPAISVGYARWWRPDEIGGMGDGSRPDEALPNTGPYRDGFGNRVYVASVGNPVVPTEKNRYIRAEQKASGFGLVRIDTTAKTYKCESYRFLADPSDAPEKSQYPGWPITLHEEDMGGSI